MMERSYMGVKAEDRSSLQKAEGRSVRWHHDGEIIHGRESSCREVATILGSINDDSPGLQRPYLDQAYFCRISDSTTR
jgi:hypothetical protein